VRVKSDVIHPRAEQAVIAARDVCNWGNFRIHCRVASKRYSVLYAGFHIAFLGQPVPAEVAKTRLQLDAELRRGNEVYSGPMDAQFSKLLMQYVYQVRVRIQILEELDVTPLLDVTQWLQIRFLLGL
jgi:hypothetical protein